MDASGATYYTMNDTQRKIYDVNLFSVPAQKVRGGAPLAVNWKWPRVCASSELAVATGRHCFGARLVGCFKPLLEVPSDCQKQCPTLHRPRHTHTDGRTHTSRQMEILIRSCDGGYDRTTIAGPGPGQKARNERITHGKRTGKATKNEKK